MFNLFNRKIECAKCNKELEKRKFHTFDESRRGSIKNKKPIKVCTHCLIEKLKESLSSYSGNLIVIQPFKPFVAYQFHTFEDMKKYNFPESKINLLKECIKKNVTDSNEKQSFILFSPQLYKKSPSEMDINLNISGNRLNIEELLEQIRSSIEREKIYFDEVLPPTNGDGILTPFEI